jgi:hypothetical protein
MLILLQNLEPRQEFENNIIYEELDEVNEIIFFVKGTVDIGFEINHKKHYVLRLCKNIAVGAYNMSMGRRTKFIYLAKTYCSGYSIRRSNWIKIIQEDDFRNLTRNLV